MGGDLWKREGGERCKEDTTCWEHVSFLATQAVLAGGGFSRQSYREGFDISIPVFNPITRKEKFLNSAAARYGWN